jgi:hypothetical protein
MVDSDDEDMDVNAKSPGVVEHREKLFRTALEGRSPLNINYFGYCLVYYFNILCCCMTGFCRDKSYRCRKRLDKVQKFKIAFDRLSGEQDIQNLIQMNRVTRLLHKARFAARQRIAVNYSHKFIINEEDLVQKQKEKKKETVSRSDRKVAV